MITDGLTKTALVCEVWGRTSPNHDADDEDSRGMGFHNQVYFIDQPNSRQDVPWRANSFHAGGLQMALGDGSVHFASDDIDIEIFQAFSTIAGGEVNGLHF